MLSNKSPTSTKKNLKDYNMTWQTVIGLEVHVQLATHSKIFSGSATQYGAPANAQASAVDLALPGTLPVFNKKALEMAIKFGLAVNARINPKSIFARKNYFYPDLPKGYQISQFESPIVIGGEIILCNEDNTTKRITLTRAHLEEDAGKSIHHFKGKQSGIDLNRAGTPLLEIVSDPVMHCPSEAVQYLKTLHTLVRYLEICDGNMQEGSFRCDANVSVRRSEAEPLGTRIEIKNLNSFRFVEKALQYEINRQIDALEESEKLIQETRLYDPDRNETRPMREKEESNDYRYFPDPDLLPLIVTQKQIDEIASTLPELPQARQNRFVETYHLRFEDAAIFIEDKSLADYFEETVKYTKAPATTVANWILGTVLASLNKTNLTIETCPVSAQALAELLDLVHDNTVSGKIAKTVFEYIWQGEGNAKKIIEIRKLSQVSDDAAIRDLIEKVLKENPEQVANYRAGKEKLFAFFVGQVMKLSKGQANPTIVDDYLKKALSSIAT
jgi:aspartyl-tRNA(Asn)/glutamyl-tRNA(Gln) amidotransferase subunit B